MNNENRVVFTKRDFGTDELLYLKIGMMIRLLIESGNIITLYNMDEKSGVVVIEYAHDDDYNPKPYWLNEEEQQLINKYRGEEHEDVIENINA